jgi:hypothetical protein
MMQFIEVTAARVGAAIQNVCANVDFEVMSLPSGSLIAVLLWLYAIAISSIRRAATEIRAAPVLSLAKTITQARSRMLIYVAGDSRWYRPRASMPQVRRRPTE